tara:strand:+ start:392 stop:613 length:222 start_codon:yes stop_codon:yes gene_type:complete
MSDDSLKGSGITTFEFQERLRATLILTSLFCNLKENKSRSSQTNYLLNNDVMTDEEWDLYLQLRWPEFKDDKN